MKTTKILKSETRNRCLKHLVALHPLTRSLAVCAGALIVLFGASGARAQQGLVYSVNIVGCVPDMTINLLTAPLTTAQRQALHAQNFNQLPPSARAVYLHAVAYAVSFAVASNGEFPTSERLAQHLKDILAEQGTMAIYTAPAIPPEYPQLAVHMAVVGTELEELNIKISGAVANNTNFQQAMYAGAVHGIWDFDYEF